MFGLFRGVKNKRGSVTVEAAIALPLVICVIMSIAFFIRLAYIQNVMQHALNDTAREISAYSYIYSVTIQEEHDRLKDTMEAGKATFNKHLTETFDAMGSLNSSKSEIETSVNNIAANPDVETTKANVQNILKSIEDGRASTQALTDVFTEIKNNPKKELISIACIMADGTFERAKTALAEPLVRIFIKKHLDSDSLDADARLKSFSIDGEFKGLDFSQSKIFADKKSIDIIVRYTVKTGKFLPIRFLPDIHIIQRSTVRAWLNGDGSGFKKPETATTDPSSTQNLWETDPLDRGKEIQKLEGRNVPSNYPVITKEENGNITKIISVDLDEPTYKKPGNVERKLREAVNALTAFEGANYAGKEIKKEDINSRTLVVVIPEGSRSSASAEVQAVLSKYESNKDFNKGITVQIKEAYGSSAGQESTEEENADPEMVAQVRAQTDRNAISKMSSFYDDLEIRLKNESLTLPEFNKLRLTPNEMLTPEEIQKLKRLRDFVPMPTSSTLMSKAITKETRDNFLNNGQYSDTVGGYISRAQDTKGLNTYKDYYDSLKLDYKNSPYNPENQECMSIIRFTTGEPDKISVPYGGITTDDLKAFSDATGTPISELERNSWPFSGNGFTVADGAKTIPEFHLKKDIFIEIKNGAAIYDIYQDGTEKLVAVYINNKWLKVKED